MAIKIGILNPNGLELSAQKALDCLVHAFSQQNIKVHLCLYTDQIPKADLLIGAYTKSPILRDLVDQGQVPLTPAPEAILIQELTIGDQTPLWACAYDSRGLLYVLYELTERITAQSVPALYKPTQEEPAIKLRGVLDFIPSERLKNGWTLERDYWQSFFAMLIRNRFNCFTLVFNSSSGTPVFPYLLSVPEHPEVNLFPLPEAVRAGNLQVLKELSELASDSGLDFHLGLWNYYPGYPPLPFRVPGVNPENIGAYLYRSLKQLIFACPEIKGLEFKFQRAPLEPDFAFNSIVQAVLDTGNKLTLKFYTNQLTTDVIDLLQVSEVNTFLTREGWDGNCGLPYLRTEEEGNDLFTDYGPKIIPAYQLTTPASLIWGDPDYFHQLLPVLKNHGYDCLQLIAPTSTGSELVPALPVGGKPFGQWEFARHWYRYILCGRLAYHPGTSGEVLIRDFHRRFGEKGNDLAELYRLTGKVLPLFHTIHKKPIPGSQFDTGGLLASYLRTPSGDPALFADCREYIRTILERTESTKIPPPVVVKELACLGQEIRQKAQELQNLTLYTSDEYVTEWKQTLEQAEMIGGFALFHSAKLQAAMELALFMETKDPFCLEKALHFLKEARLCWERLPFTARSADSRLLLMEDEKRLQILLAEYRKRGAFLVGFDFGGQPVSTDGEEEKNIYPDYYIEEGFTFLHAQAAYDPEIGYGWLNTRDLQATPAPAVRLSERDLFLAKAAGINQFHPYENQLLNKLIWSRQPASFQVDLNPGAYQVQLTFSDHSPEARRHGPMRVTVNDRILADELVVSPGKRVDLRETIEVTDGKLIFSFSCPPDQDWFISALTIHPVAPLIRHIPLNGWIREEPLSIRASVTGVNPIGQVILNYQTENERGYHMLIMTPVGNNGYLATIPAAYLEQGHLINYYITALDNRGKEGSLGSFDQPFSVPVRQTGALSPTLFHFPPSPADGEDLITLKCTVRPTTEVEKVIIYYINEKNLTNQVMMERGDADDEYRVDLDLSGAQLLPPSLLKYRFVVKLKNGDQAFFPNPLISVPYFRLKMGPPSPC